MKERFKHILILLLVIALLLFTLSGWYSEQNIDHLAYVVALGFDVGTDNKLKLSFQISVPGSSEESSGSSQSDSSIVTTIECSSFNSGINLLNSYLSKESNLSHCKMIVFSEEFAKEGISDTLYTLMNNIEIRPDCNVLVSRCNADYFLKNSKPTLEKLSARYYEIAPTSSEYTGYTEGITLNDFFSGYTDSMQNCYAILGGINTQSTQSADASKTFEEQDSTNKADESLITGNNKIENMGLAVFNGDTLVGELDGLETICHQIISNSLNSCVISIQSPFDTSKTISFKVRLAKNTNNQVDLVNNSAYITSKIKLEARILTMEENSNYLSSSELEELENSLNSYLTSKLYDYLYKVSKEFKSDIDGFGKYVVQNFKTYDEWENFDWLNRFEDSFFYVTVDTNIKSGYVLQ